MAGRQGAKGSLAPQQPGFKPVGDNEFGFVVFRLRLSPVFGKGLVSQVKMNAAAVKTLAGILAVAILASGCAHTVEYDLSQQDKVSGKKISQVVEVKKFMDSIPKRTEGVVV
ncbi:MAG: hypothetical protein AAB288_01860, partial [Acidobacteriota bacterium]